MRKSFVRLLCGTWLAFALCGGAIASSALRSSQAAVTWQAQVGGQSADHALQAQAYFPSKLTINEGDTVSWTFLAVHTVTFLSGGASPDEVVLSSAGPEFNPAVAFPAGGPAYDGTGYANSGILPGPGGAAYALTFSKAGTYPYVCELHPGMAAQVLVQPAGSAYPITQEQINTQANADLADKLSQAQRQAQSAQVASKPAANGATSYTVANGVGGNLSSVVRFLPTELKVKAGDSVTWALTDPHEIHSVTFYDPAGPVPLFLEPMPQPNGPPKLLVRNAAPEGGTAVEKAGLYNSGIMASGQSYTFSFPKPGVYSYVCTVHTNEAMFGKVIVEAAGQPASLPTTGAGAMSLPLWLLMAVALLLAAIGLFFRRIMSKARTS